MQSQNDKNKNENTDEMIENVLIKPMIQGLICGAAHLIAFHFMRRYFESKQWM
ncbi:transmembrane protein, putative (macronuclear) [Tetrahymena thermophila SB210]|uniref:Transmembrane protein, putative n=1 Tax=Tetrahymena thermophila (strain SB210) TaxID=312017 RepID=I7M9G0_TETTS|nr:transmembrane protein, putative [Tetrahymena thermophila SB210]EAS01601.1 transmembrane protein, putative [Tetrahymena thermophila SB210]|eukprot:XP_001021846.1 transmembrane protein, putative [Tetrahymena thermophila SB210]